MELFRDFTTRKINLTVAEIEEAKMRRAGYRKINNGDTLLADPCYIAERLDELGQPNPLLFVELWGKSCDDGTVDVEWDGEIYTLGVDSGEVKVLRATGDGWVKLDNGFSPVYIIDLNNNVRTS